MQYSSKMAKVAISNDMVAPSVCFDFMQKNLMRRNFFMVKTRARSTRSGVAHFCARAPFYYSLLFGKSSSITDTAPPVAREIRVATSGEGLRFPVVIWVR